MAYLCRANVGRGCRVRIWRSRGRCRHDPGMTSPFRGVCTVPRLPWLCCLDCKGASFRMASFVPASLMGQSGPLITAVHGMSRWLSLGVSKHTVTLGQMSLRNRGATGMYLCYIVVPIRRLKQVRTGRGTPSMGKSRSRPCCTSLKPGRCGMLISKGDC